MELTRLTEQHVQAIWYDAALRPETLTAHTGETVRVLFPGEWNRESGPDFRHAVLQLVADDSRIEGDVEIHVAPSDWVAHGHERDTAYRDIIAHVTWYDGEPPDTLPPQTLSFSLASHFNGNKAFALEAVDVAGYPYAHLPSAPKPCAEKATRDRAATIATLLKAGQERLETKAAALRASFAHTAPHQVFYSEILAALGYKHNADAFRRLAARVPLDSLPRETGSAHVALQSAASFETWSQRATRPTNSPDRRLRAAARLFTSPAARVLTHARDFSPATCRGLVKLLQNEAEIGRGRAAAMLANIVVPFAIACGHVSTTPAWLPPEDISSPMRDTAFRVFGRDHNPAADYAGNDILLQGLVHVRRTHCLQDGCRRCPAAA